LAYKYAKELPYSPQFHVPPFFLGLTEKRQSQAALDEITSGFSEGAQENLVSSSFLGTAGLNPPGSESRLFFCDENFLAFDS